jgi:hypothetical protein
MQADQARPYPEEALYQNPRELNGGRGRQRDGLRQETMWQPLTKIDGF